MVMADLLNMKPVSIAVIPKMYDRDSISTFFAGSPLII